MDKSLHERVIEAKPGEVIKCTPDDLVYTSNPPQYKCVRCGAFWIASEDYPICRTNGLYRGNKLTAEQAYIAADRMFNHKCSRCKGNLPYAWDEKGLCDECTRERNKIEYDQATNIETQ